MKRINIKSTKFVLTFNKRRCFRNMFGKTRCFKSLINVSCSYLCFCFLLAITSAKDFIDCDESQCKGPIRFYKDLNCKPIFKNTDDCCATEYDCSHLNGRSADKCYANGHEYEIGERLKDEDIINPCESVGCYCTNTTTEKAKFSCAVVDCFPKEARQGCYLRRKLDTCCGSEEVCPENLEDRFKCNVDGKTYLDGERFFSTEDNNMLCQCMEGYEVGKNILPFCRRTSCETEKRKPSMIRKNCAPVYGINESPNKSCNTFFRCQNSNDTVIRKGCEQAEAGDKNVCKFGDLKLYVGDELNESTTNYFTKCTECVCEVPPVVTCRRLSDEKCKKKYLRETDS